MSRSTTEWPGEGPIDYHDVPLLESLSDSERDGIRSLFRPIELDEDEIVFFEGEAPRNAYVVTAGRLKLVKHSEDGRDITLHISLPGDLIGGVAAFGRRPHTFTAQALVPSQVLVIAGPDLARIMDRYPGISRAALEDLIQRLTEAHETMKSLAVERVERRIARQVLKLAERVGREVETGTEINVPLRRQDVADIAGTTVETAIRVLSRWRKAGLVRTVKGRLVLLDEAGLRQVAEDSR